MSKEQEFIDYLNDIIITITDIEEFTFGMSYEMFSGDKKTINAVIRSLEVLGEATKHIPLSFRKKYPDIPWNKMAGMRSSMTMGVDLMNIRLIFFCFFLCLLFLFLSPGNLSFKS